MAVLDRARRAVIEDPTQLDKAFLAKLNRGRERLQSIAPARDEAFEFYRGNHFVYVDPRGKLQTLADGAVGVRGPGKPTWRARQSRNFIFDVVLREAAQATQRVPSYQVVPSTSDPSDVAAASLAEKVALYGYHRWELRRALADAVIHAVIGGEAFAWPFFDTTIGPFLSDEQGTVGQGDVRVRIFGSNECYWEPGLRFDRSPWHAVEQARPIDQVMQGEGYFGGKLTPDAAARSLSSRGRNQGDRASLVLVTDYLERPCPKYPYGRWLTIANGRQIVPERLYPSQGEQPVLRKLSYAPDPDSDRDLGLVSQLLDANRTVNDAESKAVEWKNHCLIPRVVVPPGLMGRQRWSDEPGKVYEIPDPDRNFKVIETPSIPPELFSMADRAREDLLRIAGQNDLPSGVESGKAIQALLDKNQARSALFIAELADFHGRLAHDCLVQVQDNYTEPRLLQIKGDWGWESIHDFKGADLRGQVDVRVFTDSIEPRTKQAIEQRLMTYAQMGWIGPQEAMTAIETGAGEAVINNFARDEARAGRIIQRIKQGTVGEMPNLPSGRTAPDGSPEFAPGWMPRYSDNLAVFRDRFEQWMKTEEFEQLPPSMQNVAAVIYAGVLQMEAQKAQEAQMAQEAQAERYGMQNAAKPQEKGTPSLPSPNGDAPPPTPA
ncbi:MAG: hypothetical protein ACRDLD_02200 [Thermoleophilaceae bacterium]